MVWNGIIAGYLFLAGVGAGSFAFAAMVGWKDPEARKLKMAGMIIGLLCVGIGTLMLVVDAKAGLHNPLRFIMLLTNFNSVMAWGTVILSVFLLVAFVEIVLLWKTKSTPKWLDGVGVALAVCVAAYTGVLLSASPAYPLWNFPVLPVLFLVSATATGFAACELAGYALDREVLERVELPAWVAVALPAVEALVVVVLLVLTGSASGVAAEAGAATVAALTSGSYAVAFWIGFVALGLAVPLAVSCAALAKKRHVNGAMAASWACILVGGFMLRYLVVMAAVPIVAY